ncbi:type I restriction endonuclease subunit R [Desulfobulbus sp. US4]|nr:type I restriction endonuclease subunit R [Desulfobulbus sp. US4]
MADKPNKESHFEIAIEAWLLEHAGYQHAAPSQFDPALALDKTTLMAFLKESQPETYDALAKSYGPNKADSAIVQRIAAECDARGLLDVLRNGVKDRGQHLQLAYFKPPTSLNPDTEKRYSQNRLTVMRQVPFDTKARSTLDMLLSLNGLPIATVELKNPFTGQQTVHAIKQYIENRVPTTRTPLLQFKKRALVHFAVDPDEVFMTTRLAGSATYFLPFNTGNQGGKGNPTEHDYSTGYTSGYLWEEIWQRDSWLDIIHRFIHLEEKERSDPRTGKKKTTETLIFPRYHQLIATRKLLDATRDKGAGENYLIQHSAGSGKTNTISWTAHQLASLHDQENQPIFSSVIVVSDRRNLDKQLQDSIYQIEHKHGLVVLIDEKKHAADLAEELNRGSKIIITTLQKFSFLMGKVKDLSDKRFAVIVDEAHSSQSGRSAGSLRGVLGGGLGNAALNVALNEEETLAQAENLDRSEPEPPSLEDLVLEEAKSRGRQANISFYAFTATPKHKTLEMFGVPAADGRPAPFHLYSMRQAIEEKFILDVLRHYSTYNSYFKLSKAVEDDPELDSKKAKKAIARFMSLHPHNLSQKTEIMVEHFRRFTKSKINGQAKAMLVTRSRLHAVRYKRAFDRYLADQGYQDIKVLVAFSGLVQDPNEPDLDGGCRQLSEESLNGFKEKELPQRFASPEYQLLIVAEKYQTGFDQPLLHTMFVDKPLSGLKAVQTLSRLNRSAKDKGDTFILDFANRVEDIQEAFTPYFQSTEIDQPTEPNQIYTLLRAIQTPPVIRPSDVDEFARIYFKPQARQSKRDHGALYKWIAPAVQRYQDEYRDSTAKAGEEKYLEQGEQLKADLRSFTRLYAFISQIIDWQDTELERNYAYGLHLLAKLPYRSDAGMLDLDDELALASYRNEKTFEGNAALEIGEKAAPLYGPSAVGTGRAKELEQSPLSVLIAHINSRFKTDWTAEDGLLVVQVIGDLAQDERLRQQAQANSAEQFSPVFEPEAIKAIVARQDRNAKIVKDFMTNGALRQELLAFLLHEVYAKAHGADHRLGQ